MLRIVLPMIIRRFFGMFSLSLILTGCVVHEYPNGAVSPFAQAEMPPSADYLPPLEVAAGIAGQEPPPLQFDAPPDVVVVPSNGAPVYMVPNVTGVYFYNNYWYRFYSGRWFRTTVYNGSWGPVALKVVPMAIVNVPPEYPRYLPRGYQRVHYNDFNRNWNTWEREQHWQKQDWYRREATAEVKRDRYSQIKAEREMLRPSGNHSNTTPSKISKPDYRQLGAKPVPKFDSGHPGGSQSGAKSVPKPDSSDPGIRQPETKPVPRFDSGQPGGGQSVAKPVPRPNSSQPGIRQPETKPVPMQKEPKQQTSRQPVPKQQEPTQPTPKQHEPKQQEPKKQETKKQVDK